MLPKFGGGFRRFSDLRGPIVDSFGRPHTYLRISLTERCNLRCRYCMPEGGVDLSPSDRLLTRDEIRRLASIFVGKLAVNKIKITGGEPLVRKDCVSIVSDLASLRSCGLTNLGITTNGILLHNRLHDLRSAGIQSINISLDTLRLEKFEFITRRKGFNHVWRSIQSALQLDLPTVVKLNVVVMKGFNEDEILDFVELTKDLALDVRFIEYMPFDGNKWSTEKMYPYFRMLDTIKARYRSELLPLDRDHVSDTALPFKIKGHSGTIGFISSMSKNFCGSCNRVRITADGNLKVCLFDNKEVSLRDCLRSDMDDEAICKVVASALSKKKRQHPGGQAIAEDNNRPMILIARRWSSTKSGQNSGGFTHLDPGTGHVKMVDVSSKPMSVRKAIAEGEIHVGSEIMAKIRDNQVKKGNVLTTAKLAGIMAAKSTSNLIPLCHPINLSDIRVDFEEKADSLRAVAQVTSVSSTGVEMEALTAVSVALLTIYDMCKSLGSQMIIRNVCLKEKTKSEIKPCK